MVIEGEIETILYQKNKTLQASVVIPLNLIQHPGNKRVSSVAMIDSCDIELIPAKNRNETK